MAKAAAPAPAPLLPSDPPLPTGITVTYVAHYQVGPYRYTDLACAEAELARQLAK